MRESKFVNKRREIVLELKALIDQYKYRDNIYLVSEKADLSKYKRLIKEISQGFQVMQSREQIKNHSISFNKEAVNNELGTDRRKLETSKR